MSNLDDGRFRELFEAIDEAIASARSSSTIPAR